jgi:WD40 repeat protein
LAVGSGDKLIRIFNLNSASTSPIKVLTGHSSSVYGLVELPNGDLASIQNNGTLFYWNINDGSHYFIKQVGNPNYIHYCMIALNQNEIGICSGSMILVYDIKSASVKYNITSSVSYIWKVNLMPNERLFVYGPYGFSVLDLQQRKELKYWVNDPNYAVASAMFVNSSSVDMVSHGNGLTTHSDLRLWKTF